MSTDTTPTQATLKTAAGDYWARVKSGDIGSLPAVLGLVALCGVFTAMSDVFLTAGNFANLPKRVQGRAGVIEAKRGKAYIVRARDLNEEKRYIVKPINLRKIK